MNRYLVTGGAGFIGSHLVDQLLSTGSEVRVLDNFRNGHIENLEDALKNPAFSLIHGDITDRDTCERAVNGVEGVFHLACLGVRHSIHNPVENHQVNALGSLYLLEASRRAGIERFLYMSTSEVYGDVIEFPIHEMVNPRPLTVYGSSKLAGENYARSYFTTYGFPTVCVRCFNNYGERSHFEGDSGEVIPRFILRVLAGKAPQIFGDGRHTRDFLYVKDSVRYLEAIMHANKLDGEVVNLGYGVETTIAELAERVLTLCEAKGSPEYLPERPADVPRLLVDSKKLQQTVQLTDLLGFEEGLKRTISYMKQKYEEDPSIVERIITKNWMNK